MESDNLEDNLNSISSEDEIILVSIKSKMSSKSTPLYQSQIKKFKQLVTSDHPNKNITNGTGKIKFHTYIILGIINNCITQIANIPHMETLLRLIRKLSDIFKHDMGKPVSNKYIHMDHLQSLYQMTHKRRSCINEISEDLDAKKLEHTKFTKEKTNHINHTLQKIELARGSLEQEIWNIVYDFEGINVSNSKVCSLRMHTKNDILKDVTNKLNMTIQTNKKEESSLKNRKQKLDLQLAEWIEKYDEDIEKREKELQELNKEYKISSTEFTELKIVMNEHKVLYNKCVAERTTEEKRIFDMKLEALMYTRAAKTLQRAWRTHRAQQKRKKRKGGKRKKKKIITKQ